MEVTQAEVTPKFFSRVFPGQEPMNIELFNHWPVDGGTIPTMLNLFFYRGDKKHSRIRVQLTKADAQLLAKALTQYADELKG